MIAILFLSRILRFYYDFTRKLGLPRCADLSPCDGLESMRMRTSRLEHEDSNNV